MKPKKFGGPEHRPDVALSVAYELARADGSAGWVWAVMSIHDLLVALWPEEFQKEYWAKNTLSASSFAPNGKAAPANGGCKISGKWTFSSGIDNADWLLLGVFFGPPSGGSPIPDIRYVMLPKGDYKVIDDWYVFGLRGSGSKGVVVEDVFVPNHRICGLADMIQGTTPGSKVHDSPLYKASVWGIIPFTISSPANGMARGALDAFIDDMKVREGSYDHSPLSKKPGMQLVVAEASAMIDAADLLYRRSFTETIDKIFAGEPLSLEHRARSRRDQGWSVITARQAAEKLFSAQAGRGIYEGNRIQRAYADVHALSGHIVAGWEMPAYSYGQVMLGGPPSDPFT
jgi:alkylation response protein AidB-like acyl-CoA dehydrogenase